MKLRRNLPLTIVSVVFFLVSLIPIGTFFVGYFHLDPSVAPGFVNSLSLIISALAPTSSIGVYTGVVMVVSGALYLIFFFLCFRLFFSQIEYILKVWSAPSITQRNRAFCSLVNKNQSILFYMVLYAYLVSYFAYIDFSEQSRFLLGLILACFVITSFVKNLISSKRVVQNIEFFFKISLSVLVLCKITEHVLGQVGYKIMLGATLLGNNRLLPQRSFVYLAYSYFVESICFFVLSIIVLMIIFSYTNASNFSCEGYIYRRKKFSFLIVFLIFLSGIRIVLQFYCLDKLPSFLPSGEDAQNLVKFILNIVKESYWFLSHDILPLLGLSIAGFLCNTHSPQEE